MSEASIINRGPTSSQEKTPADLFMNIYVPSTVEGKRIKLAFAALRMNQPNERQIIELWKRDPALATQKLTELLFVEFNEPTAKDAPGLIAL